LSQARTWSVSPPAASASLRNTAAISNVWASMDEIFAAGLSRRSRAVSAASSAFALAGSTRSSLVMKIWSASATCRTDSTCSSRVCGPFTASTVAITAAMR
jgi:hypothetical protein